jgi:hypothetical protein
MADTGAPWNIPYAEPSDLVRDWPALSEDVAEAVADGLSAAGGLVAVKHVLKTDTFVSGSVAAGANVAVTGLSIAHTLANAANKLIVTAWFGTAATGSIDRACGIAVADDGTVFGVGDAASTRPLVGAGFLANGADNSGAQTSLSVTYLYAPGDTNSHTYTVRAVNIADDAQTLYVNRVLNDTTNVGRRQRSASSLVIQEVKV